MSKRATSAKMRWGKFYWSDWASDPKLKLCSFAARGFWMELLCIAAANDGEVLVNGKRPTMREIAILTGGTEEEAEQLSEELLERGVMARTCGGVWYSGRMKLDASRRKAQVEFGKLGGNPALRKDTGNGQGDKGQDKIKRLEARDRDKSPPSGDPPKTGSAGADAPPPAPKRGDGVKRSIPDGFPDAEAITVARTAVSEAGVQVDVAYHAQRFRNWALSAGHKYVDWTATWRNWIAREVKDQREKAGPAKRTGYVRPAL